MKELQHTAAPRRAGRAYDPASYVRPTEAAIALRLERDAIRLAKLVKAVSPEIRRKRVEARLTVTRIIAERKMQERTTRT